MTRVRRSQPVRATAVVAALLSSLVEARAAVFPVGDAAGLVAAIVAANATPELDEIELTADVVLTAVDNVLNGPNGTPPITTPVLVRGHGFAIARAEGSPEFRLLQVRGAFFGTGALTLEAVVLRGGDVSTVDDDCFLALDACGGALLSHFGEVTIRQGSAFFNAGGNASLSEVLFQGNRAGREGGAIANAGGLIGDPATIVVTDGRFEANEAVNGGGAIQNQAELEVVESVFTLNRVTGVPPFGGGGGAVYNTTINGLATFATSRFTENEAPRGGALSNYNASDLTLENSDVTENRALGSFGDGGGIWSDNNTTLIVRNSRVVANETGPFGNGGGIYSGQNNALTLTSSTVDHNIATRDGGGLYMESLNATIASTITNSTIDFNTAAADGGGIYKDGGSPVTIVASSISDNTNTGFAGGGLYVSGGTSIPPVGVIVRDSTIARNTMLTGEGGGIANLNQGRLTIERTAIIDNTVTGVGGVSGIGGGVFSNQTSSSVTITNSTIAGNSAQSNGGATYNNNASQMIIAHATITDNTADLQGGGVFAVATTSVKSSLLSGNRANHPVNPQQDNCGGIGGLLSDLGGNLIDDAGGGVCPAGFVLSAAINLGLLTDNGGPTVTQALLGGSVAIDAGGACGLATDQRGVPRAGSCDSGAFEGNVVVPLVRFAIADSDASEDGGQHDVDVVLDNTAGTVAGASVTVFVAIVGSATSGVDYDLATSVPLTFTGGTWPVPGTSVVLPVSLLPLPDAGVEGFETVRLELRDAGLAGPVDLGAPAAHVVTLADACPPAPELTCRDGFAKGTLVVDEQKAGKEKLTAGIKRGPITTQADFGNPLVPDGTAVRLCLYDDQAQSVATLLVDRAAELCGTKGGCWKSIGKAPPIGKGFAYADKATAADGVKLVKLKAGKPGKTQLDLKAANKSDKGQTALPTGITAALATSAGGVTLQVHTSDAGCFTRTFTEVKKHEEDFFKAK